MVDPVTAQVAILIGVGAGVLVCVVITLLVKLGYKEQEIRSLQLQDSLLRKELLKERLERQNEQRRERVFKKSKDTVKSTGSNNSSSFLAEAAIVNTTLSSLEDNGCSDYSSSYSSSYDSSSSSSFD